MFLSYVGCPAKRRLCLCSNSGNIKKFPSLRASKPFAASIHVGQSEQRAVRAKAYGLQLEWPGFRMVWRSQNVSRCMFLFSFVGLPVALLHHQSVFLKRNLRGWSEVKNKLTCSASQIIAMSKKKRKQRCFRFTNDSCGSSITARFLPSAWTSDTRLFLKQERLWLQRWTAKEKGLAATPAHFYFDG